MTIVHDRITVARPSSARHVARDERLHIDAFCEFYSKVVQQKDDIQRKGVEIAATDVPQIQQKLLESFEMAIASMAEGDKRSSEETQYLMLAMADDVFLRLEWNGKNKWAENPLEATLPQQSRYSGEEVFRRIEAILEGKRTVRSSVLHVYLAALTLGFRGRYAVEGATDFAKIHQDLVSHVSNAVPSLARHAPKLCAQLDRGPRNETSGNELPALSRGVLAVVAVIIGWVVIGEGIWLYRTMDLDDVLDHIEEAI